MVHNMRLQPVPFEMIKNGTKTIELRLYDEKRRKIQIGDDIIFVHTESRNETLKVKVIDLYIFDSFAELYKVLPLLECGYTKEDVDTASPEDMDLYYSGKEQQQYGVVGIKVRKEEHCGRD